MLGPSRDDDPTLNQLWRAAERISDDLKAMASRGALAGANWQLARAAEADVAGVLEPLGLLLVHPLEREGYDDTPLNTLAFAATGGDGVHFRLIAGEDGHFEGAPVVMTVPCYPANLILGANLREFLGLGVFRGYGFLEQLVYEPGREVERIASRAPCWPDDEPGDPGVAWMLGRFVREMALSPWPEVRGRLTRLQRDFSPLLKWDDCEPFDNGAEF